MPLLCSPLPSLNSNTRYNQKKIINKRAISYKHVLCRHKVNAPTNLHECMCRKLIMVCFRLQVFTLVFIKSLSLRSFSWKWFTVVCSSFFMYCSLDKSDRGLMAGSWSTLFLLPPKVKQRAIPEITGQLEEMQTLFPSIKAIYSNSILGSWMKVTSKGKNIKALCSSCYWRKYLSQNWHCMTHLPITILMFYPLSSFSFR